MAASANAAAATAALCVPLIGGPAGTDMVPSGMTSGVFGTKVSGLIAGPVPTPGTHSLECVTLSGMNLLVPELLCCDTGSGTPGSTANAVGPEELEELGEEHELGKGTPGAYPSPPGVAGITPAAADEASTPCVAINLSSLILFSSLTRAYTD